MPHSGRPLLAILRTFAGACLVAMTLAAPAADTSPSPPPSNPIIPVPRDRGGIHGCGCPDGRRDAADVKVTERDDIDPLFISGPITQGTENRDAWHDLRPP